MRHLGIVICVFIFAAERAKANDVLLERFNREAPLKWREYISWASNIEGTASFRDRDHLKGKVTRRNVANFYVKAPCGLVLSGRSRATDIPTSARGVNREYGFSLGQAANGWFVEEVSWPKKPDKSQRAGDRAPERGDPTAFGTALRASCKGLLIKHLWFSEMVQGPYFEVTDIAIVSDKGEQLIRVEFTYRPEFERSVPVRDGMVVVDPQRYWLIRSARVQAAWRGGTRTGWITVDNEYSDKPFKVPVLTRNIERTKIFDSNNVLVRDHNWEREYQYRELTKTKDEDYTLTAFGLPEPVAIQESNWSSFSIALNIVVILCLALAILLSLWSRSRANAMVAQ